MNDDTERPASLDRWAVERAIKASDLAPPSRLLMHTLLTHVSNGTLVVPAVYAPSLTALTKETGLSRSTVADHLNLLEQDGWLDRRRPTAQRALADRARTAYRINVPASVLTKLEDEPVREADQSASSTSPGGGLVEKEPQVSTGPPDGLVREPDQSGSWTSPGGGLVKQEDLLSTGPGAGLVREADWTSPGAGLNPMFSPTCSSPTEKKTKGGAGGTRSRAKTNREEHPRFAEWYAAYPLRKERGAAVAAFNKAATKVDDVETLFAAAKRYRETDPHVLRGFIKNPATWLNKECWLDEIAQVSQPHPTATGGYQPYRNPTDHSVYDEEF